VHDVPAARQALEAVALVRDGPVRSGPVSS
jgi:hypothetical protein